MVLQRLIILPRFARAESRRERQYRQTHMANDRGLERLIGEELNEIPFVMDNVEFHFNGPVLRALTPPVVRSAGLVARFPEAGSRDRLCDLIGKTVATVSAVNDVAIDLSFTDGATVTIPLDAESRVGPEAANFQSDRINSPLFMVW